MVRSRIVTGAGVRLRVFEHGDPAGPTVVLVHGYPDTSAVWNRVVARLADEHHVVTYDVRGAGGSERPPDTARYALPWLVADLHAVIDAVAPGRSIHLVGHDWGAIEGFAAVQDPAAPARLASFTALSAPGLDVVAHRVRAAVARPRPATLVGALRQLACSWYVVAFQVPLLATLVWRAGLGRAWRTRTVALAGPGYPAATLMDDAVAGVARYRANRPSPGTTRLHVPVRVLIGDRDPFVTPWVFDTVTEQGDDVQVEVVAGEHWLPRTHPDVVAQRVAGTVAAVETARRVSAARSS